MLGIAIRLEANHAKVSRIGEILHSYPCQTLGPIWMPLQLFSAQGVDVPNLIKIDSAFAALPMREKTGLSMGFFNISIERSVYPFFATPTDHILERF